MSLATRMSPAPPSFTSASPGAFTPAAKADRTWSAPPTISAVPAERPVCLGRSAAELADPRSRAGERVAALRRRGRRRPAPASAMSPSMVNKPRLQRPVLLDVDVGAQRRQHPVVGADEVGRPRIHVWFVLAQPHRGRRNRLLGQRRTGHRDQVDARQRRRQFPDLPVRPCVVLKNGAAQRLSAFGRAARRRAPSPTPRRPRPRRRRSRWCTALPGWSRRRRRATGRYRPRRSPVPTSAAPSRGKPGRRCRCAVSNSTVLVPVVPTSMPMVWVLTRFHLSDCRGAGRQRR